MVHVTSISIPAADYRIMPASGPKAERSSCKLLSLLHDIVLLFASLPLPDSSIFLKYDRVPESMFLITSTSSTPCSYIKERLHVGMTGVDQYV
jgi:hypothetical protein